MSLATKINCWKMNKFPFGMANFKGPFFFKRRVHIRTKFSDLPGFDVFEKIKTQGDANPTVGLTHTN